MYASRTEGSGFKFQIPSERWKHKTDGRCSLLQRLKLTENLLRRQLVERPQTGTRYMNQNLIKRQDIPTASGREKLLQQILEEDHETEG